MDTYFGDISGIRQAQVYPGLATIGRLIYTITMRHITTDSRLTHTNIDHVGIRSRDGNRTNRCTFKVAVGHIFPEYTAIGGLPDATTRRAKIEYLWMHRVTSHRYDSPSAKRAD